MTPLTRAAPPVVLCALALAACSAPPPAALSAHPWRAAMTVYPGHCGRLPGGGRGLSYRFTNGGTEAAGPVVVARFLYSRAPGLGVTGEGVTAQVSIVAPGRQGTGTVEAPAGTTFDECQVASWQVAEVGRG